MPKATRKTSTASSVAAEDHIDSLIEEARRSSEAAESAMEGVEGEGSDDEENADFEPEKGMQGRCCFGGGGVGQGSCGMRGEGAFGQGRR